MWNILSIIIYVFVTQIKKTLKGTGFFFVHPPATLAVFSNCYTPCFYIHKYTHKWLLRERGTWTLEGGRGILTNSKLFNFLMKC